jgi:curved DNA-binding protein CbpA
MASVSRVRPDYYGILGVERGASYREIEAAYGRLAREKREQRPLLNEAWEVLGNATRRAAYNDEQDTPRAKPGSPRKPEPRASRLGTYFGR